MSRLIIIIVFFLLILLIGLFLLWPKYQELTNAQAKIEGKKIELQYLQDYFSKLNQLSQKLKKYEVQLSKIDFALPSDSSLTLLSLVDFLQKASSQNDLIFQNLGSFSVTSPKLSTTPLNPLEAEFPSNIKKLHISFEIAGPYSALKNFLNTLEKSAKIIEVENVSFSSREETLLSLNLSIKTYSY